MGFGTGVGLRVLDSSGIEVTNNEFFHFMRAALFSNINELDVSSNDIHDIRSDGLNFANVDNVTIQSNHIHDFKAAASSSDHMDMIQFWTAGTTSPSSNIVISNNFLNSGAGSATQSIFMGNEVVGRGEADAEMYYQNVIIENNVIYNGHLHGISVGATNGLKINNNTVLQNPDVGTLNALTIPSIVVAGASSNVQITDNIASRIDVPTVNGTLNNNLIVQNSQTEQPNYVGILFVNAMAGDNAALSDLQALPDGVIEKMGVGAEMTAYGSGIDAPIGNIIDRAGAGVDLLKHTFSISDVLESGENVDLTNALVSWDFGDNSRTSDIAEHTYAQAGKYDVTAMISLADGQTISVSKAIQVDAPVALHSHFDNGAADLAGPPSVVMVGDKVTFEAYGDGQAARLNGDVIKYTSSSALQKNSEYSLLVDFKKDAGHEGDSGRIINLSGSLVIFVDGSRLSAVVTTDQGDVWLRPVNANVADSDWHSVALTFSGKTER